MAKQKKAPRQRAKPSFEWRKVSCAGGRQVIGLVDNRRIDGFLVPWFLDEAMDQIGALYFAGRADERTPQQGLCGRWSYIDDNDEDVELDRVRMAVPVGNVRAWACLSDSEPMGWCWEDCGEASIGDSRELIRRSAP